MKKRQKKRRQEASAKKQKHVARKEHLHRKKADSRKRNAPKRENKRRQERPATKRKSGTTKRHRRKPAKVDRRRRRMLLPTKRGTAPVTIRGLKQASRLGRYMSAVGKYLRTGETDALGEFEGQSIANHSLITDPQQLDLLAQAGALHLDQIYALPESPS